jgi:hypothetical protein
MEIFINIIIGVIKWGSDVTFFEKRQLPYLSHKLFIQFISWL